MLVSGVALSTPHGSAVAVFLAAWTCQAGYLLWAQRWFRPEDAASILGRRRTINAFAIYTVATLIVMGLSAAGALG